MPLEPALRRLDRIAGGRQADHRVPVSADPKVRRAFRAITLLLAAGFVLGVATVVIALVMTANGDDVGFAVWMRSAQPASSPATPRMY